MERKYLLRLDRFILAETRLPASPGQVWQASTTVEGIRTFFAQDGWIELRPVGAYEMAINPQAEPGTRHPIFPRCAAR